MRTGHTFRGLRAASCLLALLALAPSVVSAADNQPPGKMTFQGFLLDSAGLPLGTTAPTNVTVFFRLYKTATGTTPADKLSAEQQVVTIDKGHFSVLLGEGASTGIGGDPAATNNLASLFTGADASDRFLGIQVAGQNEIAPRIQFFPAPYANLAWAANALLAPNGTAALVASSSVVTSTLPVVATSFTGNGANLTGLVAAQIPNLDASRITSGVLDSARLPTLWTNNVTFGSSPPAWGNRTLFNGFVRAAGVSSTVPAGYFLDDGAVEKGVFGYAHTAGTWSGASLTGDIVVRALSSKLILQSGEASPGIVIDTANNVGIGTATPQSALTVNGGIRARGGPPGPGNANNVGYAFEGNGGDNDTGIFSEGDGLLAVYSNGFRRALFQDWRLSITGPGVPYNFPLGTPLHGTTYQGVFQTLASDPFYNNFPVGLRVDSWIATSSGYIAFSDRRIKDILQVSDNSQDLAQIRRLKVTDYRMKDRVQNGDRIRKGFIAQEVKEVIPEAVSTDKGIVPDLYAAPTNFVFDAAGQALELTLGKPHGLKAGDTVRVYLDNNSRDLQVTRVASPESFSVGTILKAPKSVFVYGRQVDDFLSVDYDRIFTAGIGAMQELARKVETDEARLAQLEQRVSRVESLEREVADLKKLVSRMAGFLPKGADADADAASALARVNGTAGR